MIPMTAKGRAAYYEVHNDPVNAAEAHEEAIQNQDADLETYLNLAVVYFSCGDFGYASFHHLTDEFLIKAGQRYNEVLDEATARFGYNAEVGFWRLYFKWYWTNDPIIDKCREIVESSNTLVPYFHLYAVTDDEQYYPYVVELLETVKDKTTRRKRYIWSIIDSSLTFREWRLAKPSEPEQ
jgi:hypothetical protein